MKKFFVSVFIIIFVLSVLSIVGCQNPGGPSAIDAGIASPTPTPDYNYNLYLYAQGTPQANTLVTMSSQPGTVPTQSITLYTNPDGSGIFADLHARGVWNMDVGASNGYLEGNYSIDTSTTTFTAINRGPGTITFTLKGSSNTTSNIPIIANTLVYTATLSTVAPMNYNISLSSDCTFTAAGALPVSYTISTTNGLGTLVNNGDVATITISFTSAENDYGSGFNFWLTASNNKYTIATSKMAIVKDWTCDIACYTYYSEIFTGSVAVQTLYFNGTVAESCQFTNFMYNITGPVIPTAIFPQVIGSGPAGNQITGMTTSYDSDDVWQSEQLNYSSGNTTQINHMYTLPYVDVQFTDEQSRDVIKMRFTNPLYTTSSSTWTCGCAQNGPFYWYNSGLVQGVQIP